MLGGKLACTLAVAAGSIGVLVAAAFPAAAVGTGAAPDTVLSVYTVIGNANVHTEPTHTSRVIKVKHDGDGVTSPELQCAGEEDPTGDTLWIEVNLANGGIGWMGNGQLSPNC